MQNAARYSFESAIPQLFKTPSDAHLETGGEEYLGVGAGADDGADIAAVEDGALGASRRAVGVGPLEIQQGGPDGGKGCHLGCGASHRFAAQTGFRQVFGAKPLGDGGSGGAVRWIVSLAHHLEGDGAVQKPSVEQRQPEMLCKPAGQRALAGGGRAVDGDDHAPAASTPAPRPFMKSGNPGKLVAIGAPSSMRTAWRAAAPSTRKAMAMR